MCGILAVHGLENPVAYRARFLKLSKRLRHRGPDWSGCHVAKDAILCHERLAIVGVGPYSTLYAKGDDLTRAQIPVPSRL